MGVSGRYLATRVTGSREDVMTNMMVAAMSSVACAAPRQTASSVGIGFGVKRDTKLKYTLRLMPTCGQHPKAQVLNHSTIFISGVPISRVPISSDGTLRLDQV